MPVKFITAVTEWSLVAASKQLVRPHDETVGGVGAQPTPVPTTARGHVRGEG